MFDQNRGPIFLLILLALGVIARPTGNQTTISETGPPGQVKKAQQAKPVTPKKAAGQCKDQQLGEVLKTIRGMVRTEPCDSEKALNDDLDRINKLKPEFLIVTLPDPTFLPALFDANLESIHRALETDGYLLDRFWLPWPEPEEGSKEGEANKPSKASIRSIRYERGEPGVLVLRHSAEENQRGKRQCKVMECPLIVFVVGETAKTGLQKLAFMNALDCINKLMNNSLGKNNEMIRILGPTFSGSISSLIVAIQAAQFKWSGVRFRIVTGTATREKNKSDIKNSLPTVCFRAVVENDAVTAEVFWTYLREKNIPLKYVAILTEAGTAYGQALSDHKTKMDREKMLSLPFPSEIAKLRGIYRDIPAVWGSELGKTTQLPESSGVEVKLKEMPAATDGVPSFSTEQTPLKQELTIGNIARTIRREHIQVVGINATDVLDAAFVAKLIQRDCSDTRLFTMDTDILWQHTSPKLSFYGMLTVSTYPLTYFNQIWQMPPGGELFHFPQQSAQGSFNACMSLLHPEIEQDTSAEECPPAGATPCKALSQTGAGPTWLIEYSHPTDVTRAQPPVWLSVVGRDGFWPVRILERPQEKKSSLLCTKLEGGRGDLLLPPPSRLFWILSLLLTANLVWSLWSLFYIYILKVGKKKELLVSYCLPEKPGFCGNNFLFMSGIVRLGFYFPLAFTVFAYSSFMFARSNAMAAAVGAVTVLALPALYGYALFRAAVKSDSPGNESQNPGRSRNVIWTNCLVGLSGFILLGWLLVSVRGWWNSMVPNKDLDADKLFFILRNLYPANGVAPLIPMLILSLAVMAWANTQLKRLRLAEIRSPGFPNLRGDDPLLSDITGLCEQTNQEINNACAGWQMAIAGSATLMIWLLLGQGELFQGLEDVWFDNVIYAAFLGVCFLVILTLIRFTWLWILLRGLLSRIEWHPLMDAFSRLGEDIPELAWKTLWWRGGKKQMNALLGQSVRHLRLIELNRCAAIRKGLEVFLKNESQRIREDKGILSEINGELNRQAIEFAKELESCWRGLNKGKNSLNDKETGLRENFVALRFAAYFRYVTVQIWNHLSYLIVGTVCLMVAVSAYPFEPHRSLVLAASTVFAVSAAVFLTMFAQMDRNATLSKIGYTTPGKLSGNFVRWAIVYGTVPLLMAVAGVFPELGRSLFSWVGPLLNALH